jgi:hypothetical protein
MEDKSNGQRRMEENMWGGQSSSRTVEPWRRRRISHYNDDTQLESNIQIYNSMNEIIRRHFGKQMSKETQLRLHNITSK